MARSKSSSRSSAESNRNAQILIGDLLVKSGLVTPAQMADAVPISLTSSLPIGRVLVSSGFLKESNFKAAVSAQSLIRENFLHIDLAVNALSLVKEHNCTLDEALEKLGWRSEYYETTNRLGDLLVEAEILSRDDLKVCLEDCYTSGMPLGRILVLNGIVNEMQTYAALTAQVLIRERKITRAQAIEGLRLVADRNLTLEESLELDGIEMVVRSQRIRLGELLLSADLVSEIDLLSAVERGMIDEQPIGQVLVRVGLITEGALNQALRLQKMVADRKLKPMHAALVLRKVRKSGVSIEKAVKEVKAKSDSSFESLEMPELLKMLGLIGNTDLLKAVDYSSSTGTKFEDVVYQLKLVDIDTLESASRCIDLYNQKQLTHQQVMFAMQAFLASRQKIETILTRMGWNPNSSKISF